MPKRSKTQHRQFLAVWHFQNHAKVVCSGSLFLLRRVDAAGESINSFVCQRFLARNMQLAFCLFISSIALLYLWRSRLTSRVNSWNFLSNSSLINFSLIASMD